MKNITQTLWILLAALLLAGCASQSLRINNYSYLYGKREFLLHPQYQIYHRSEDTTVIYFRLNTRNLLYTRQEKNSAFTARFRIDYKIYISLEDRVAVKVDSAVFTDQDDEQLSKDLIGKFETGLPSGKDYFVAITATDLNRNSRDFKILKIFKQAESINRQAFLPFKADENIPLITDYVDKDEHLLVRYRLRETDLLVVRYFHGDFALARPPFDFDTERVQFSPDSIFTIADSAGFFPLTIDRPEGFYLLLNDSTDQVGFPLFRFPAGYPVVASGEQMVGPLRYLTTREEFEGLRKATNPKIAAENFWIDRCGSRERAREVIREFYARVQEANEFFTSYKEGWKTDRGMIYIIFGPPDGLYIRDGQESWVYGQESNVMSLAFSFKRWDNPYTENDFILERNPAFRSTWLTAVDAWRTGRLFSL